MNLNEYKKNKSTLQIEEGKRYKNFDGYYRDVLAILET